MEAEAAEAFALLGATAESDALLLRRGNNLEDLWGAAAGSRRPFSPDEKRGGSRVGLGRTVSTKRLLLSDLMTLKRSGQVEYQLENLI